MRQGRWTAIWAMLPCSRCRCNSRCLCSRCQCSRRCPCSSRCLCSRCQCSRRCQCRTRWVCRTRWEACRTIRWACRTTTWWTRVVWCKIKVDVAAVAVAERKETIEYEMLIMILFRLPTPSANYPDTEAWLVKICKHLLVRIYSVGSLSIKQNTD